jgi:hypothetical protein
MPLTRAGMRNKVIENLSQVAPPGEQFIACVHAETGPSPWLNIVFEQVPFLVLIVQSMRKYYFITLTNSTIVVNRATRLANRPKEVVAAIPISASPIAGIKKGRLWSRMYFQFPGEPKVTRINFHRIWNADVDRFIAAMPHAVHGAPATAAFAPLPQQGYYQDPNQPVQQYAQPQFPQQGMPQQQYQQPYPQQQYPQQQYPAQPQQPQFPQQQPYPQQQAYQQPQFPQQ